MCREAKTYAELLPHLLRRSKEAGNQALAAGEEVKVNELGSQFFNGVNMIKEKVKLAGLSGAAIMVWELGQDADLMHPMSLLRAACLAKNETLTAMA